MRESFATHAGQKVSDCGEDLGVSTFTIVRSLNHNN